uniref:Cyclin-like domain-containing protein n=1 Tax=Oryza glaberrima TaxID=4538 RepID=I1QNK9_ORYGL
MPADDDDASYLLCAEDAGAAVFDVAVDISTCTTEDDECCSVGGEELYSAASIAELIGGEAEYSPRSDYPDRLRSRSIDPAARAESVSWILKVQEYYGFLPLTAYLAVNYMDRFLSLRHLPEGQGWAMQLLAVACLSLAAKMEETLVPSLLDLQVECSRYVFEPRTICRMEFLILTALNWRLRSVTPFTFHISNAMVQNANSDIQFLDHCPSSMAAAAVLCATGETPSLAFVNPELAVNWCIGLAEEGISSCYQLMQQLVIGNVQRSAAAAAAVNLFSDEGLSYDSSSPPPPKRRKRSPPGT